MEKQKNNKILLTCVFAVLVAFLLFLTSSTFAKYTTSKKQTATATVAKWGISVTADTSKWFGSKYAKDESGAAGVTQSETGLLIKAGGKGKVVAPGAYGQIVIDIKGSAEVASKLLVSLGDTGTTISASDGTNVYEPIRWSVTGLKKPVNGDNENLTYQGLKNYIGTYELFFNPNTEINKKVTISWNWNFDNKDATFVDNTNNNTYGTTLLSSLWKGDLNGDGVFSEAVDGNVADTMIGLERGSVMVSKSKTPLIFSRELSLLISASCQQVQKTN